MMKILETYDIAKNMFYSKIEYVDKNTCIIRRKNDSQSTYLEIKEMVDILEFFEGFSVNIELLDNNDILIKQKI